MTKNFLKIFMLLSVFMTITMMSCTDDDNLPGHNVKYELNEVNDSDVSGDIEFVELENGKVQIQISLSGTESGVSHPAHIHFNSAAIGGDILVSLDPVDGATGSSVTIVDQTDQGGDFNFGKVAGLDAYVNIHRSEDDLATILAQGDIGSNILTGETKTYNLEKLDVDGISGIITFKQRRNGFTLAEIKLDGTPNGGIHPAHIHANSAAETGNILVSLNPVDGSTGESMTDIRLADDGTIIDFENILTLDAYVNVHLSPTELSTIVAQGDIGANELTGESITYDLNERDVEGINGEIKFEERMNGSVKATIMLEGTPESGIHPAHIHENSINEGGPIVVTFNPVDGTTGMSVSTVDQFDDGSPFTFLTAQNYNGYINVHLSPEDLDVIVSQGNIGINNN